jgi:hypothetical protein
MPKAKPQLVDIDYDEHRITTPNGGCLFTIDGKDVWLPQSLIEKHEDEQIVTMPEWLAKERGLI